MAGRWSQLLTDTIDPVLSGTTFQPGQTGESRGGPPGSGASGVWCADYSELQLSHPGLPQTRTQAAVRGYACVDLTVEVEAGRLAEARVEMDGWAEIFEELGRPDDAAAAAALIGQPGELSLPALAVLVSRLLEATAAR
jgi:hypothetical protein